MLSGSKRPATETQTPKILETFFVERLCAHSSDVREGQTEPTGQTEWEIRTTLSARQFKQIRCALLEMPNCTHTDDDVWYYEGGVRATIKRESNVHVQRKLERTRVNVPGSFTAPLFTKLVQSTEDDFSASESEDYVRSLKRQAGCSGENIPDITKGNVSVHHQLTNLPPLFSSTEKFIKENLKNFWYTMSGSLWFSRATKVAGVHVPEAFFSLETKEEAPAPPVPLFRRVRQRDSVELNKHVRLDLTHSVEHSRSCKTKHNWNVEIELLRPDATLPETVQDSGRALAEALEWVVDVVKCPK